MSLIDFGCLCFFLVYAHLSESRVIILRDYDDKPFVLDQGEGYIDEENEPKHEAININPQFRPKRMRSPKKTTLQYGRHTYHLDNFDDLKKIRSEVTESKPFKDNSISYNYADFNDWRSTDVAKDGEEEYLKDVLIFSETPLSFCDEEDCDEDRKMFRKYDDHKDWKHSSNRIRYIKRYQIVDNRHESPKKPEHPKYDSSEENNNKKKKPSKKLSKKRKKKKQKHSSESSENNSEEQSSNTWGYNKKKKHSSEESREYVRKRKKKFVDNHSQSGSAEAWKYEPTSIEDVPKIKKKNKRKMKVNYGSSGEFFMQGNNIFHSSVRKKKKHETRKRLQHFMPKRYHWEPEDIHDLGYFWFNGPKGAYPAPHRIS